MGYVSNLGSPFANTLPCLSPHTIPGFEMDPYHTTVTVELTTIREQVVERRKHPTTARIYVQGFLFVWTLGNDQQVRVRGPVWRRVEIRIVPEVSQWPSWLVDDASVLSVHRRSSALGWLHCA